MVRTEDKGLDSLSSSLDSHYEQSLSFQQKLVVWAPTITEHILLFPHWCIFAAVILFLLSVQNDWQEFLRGRSKFICQLPVGGNLEDNSVWVMSWGKARKYMVLWPDKFNEEEPKSASYVNVVKKADSVQSAVRTWSLCRTLKPPVVDVDLWLTNKRAHKIRTFPQRDLLH